MCNCGQMNVPKQRPTAQAYKVPQPTSGNSQIINYTVNGVVTAKMDEANRMIKENLLRQRSHQKHFGG